MLPVFRYEMFFKGYIVLLIWKSSILGTRSNSNVDFDLVFHWIMNEIGMVILDCFEDTTIMFFCVQYPLTKELRGLKPRKCHFFIFIDQA